MAAGPTCSHPPTLAVPLGPPALPWVTLPPTDLPLEVSEPLSASPSGCAPHLHTPAPRQEGCSAPSTPRWTDPTSSTGSPPFPLFFALLQSGLQFWGCLCSPTPGSPPVSRVSQNPRLISGCTKAGVPSLLLPFPPRSRMLSLQSLWPSSVQPKSCSGALVTLGARERKSERVGCSASGSFIGARASPSRPAARTPAPPRPSSPPAAPRTDPGPAPSPGRPCTDERGH